MLTLIQRLKDDPVWARDVLAASYDDARQRWQRRWRDGGHPYWIHPRDSVPIAFAFALEQLPLDTQEIEVDATMQTLIDDYIFTRLRDAKPHVPLARHIPRGKKQRRRSNIQRVNNQGHESGPIQSDWIGCPHTVALRGRAQRRPVEFDAVLAGCTNATTCRALEMLRDGRTLGDIRRGTGFTGPRLHREYERWHQIIFGRRAA